MPDYLEVNRANWDARADVHMGPGGYRVDRVCDAVAESAAERYLAGKRPPRICGAYSGCGNHNGYGISRWRVCPILL